MIYSPLLQKAIDFAIKTHWQNDKQYRKGKDNPYITHPLSVALILSQAGAEEDVIIAGILHDTVEDSKEPYKVTNKEIKEKFGPKVAALVDAVTEKDRSADWLTRKMKALEHIKHMDHDALLLKSADVLHNLTELVQDLKKDGDMVWERFNASKADTIKRYNALIPELKRVWLENPLIEDLEAAHQDLMELVDETK
jgi:(p)ppGpp synthase/HD superfamily hydrolase